MNAGAVSYCSSRNDVRQDVRCCSASYTPASLCTHRLVCVHMRLAARGKAVFAFKAQARTEVEGVKPLSHYEIHL